MKPKLNLRELRKTIHELLNDDERVIRAINSRTAKIISTIFIVVILLWGASYFIGSMSDEFDKVSQQYENLRQYTLKLASDCNNLANQSNSLQLAYNNLQSSCSNTQNNYNTLQSNYSILETQYLATQSRYSVLETQYSTMQTAYNKAIADYNNIFTIYGNVLSGYEGAKKVPYVIMEGRNATIVFKNLNGNLESWGISADTLEANIILGNMMRTYPLETLRIISSDTANRFQNNSKYVSLTGSSGQNYTVIDVRPYIESRNFEKVAQDLYAESNSDEQYIKEVFNIDKQITVYSTELKETPRFPLETMLEAGGDCEDTAILVASMLKAVNKGWKVQVVYMDAGNPTNPQTVNHAIVSVDTGNYKTLIETTSKGDMNPYPNGVNGWSFDV